MPLGMRQQGWVKGLLRDADDEIWFSLSRRRNVVFFPRATVAVEITRQMTCVLAPSPLIGRSRSSLQRRDSSFSLPLLTENNIALACADSAADPGSTAYAAYRISAQREQASRIRIDYIGNIAHGCGGRGMAYWRCSRGIFHHTPSPPPN